MCTQAMQKETKRVEHNISAVEERRQQVRQGWVRFRGNIDMMEKHLA